MFSLKKSVFLAVLAISAAVSAAPWASLGPKRVPETLVIVSNYKSPRLLAELIQNESRAPYILLPTLESQDDRIFFCPAKRASVQIREARLNAFIRFLNPKRIVVIGNEKLINQRYIDMLDRTIPVVRIDSVDWYRMAEELNFMLNLSHLGSNFKRLRETMLNDGKIYRPVSLPETTQVPANAVPNASDPAQENKPAESAEKADVNADAQAAAPAA